MTIPSFKKSIKIRAAFIVITALLATLLLQSIGAFSRIESTTFDHRVGLFRSDKTINNNVVIILIDDASLQSMDNELGRWPWPRSAYADLLDFFSLAGAQAFALDILFAEQQDAGQINDDDQQFVAATERAGNTVHAMQLLHLAPGGKQQSLPEDFKLKFGLSSDFFVGPDYNDFLLPFEALYKVSRDIGFLEIAPDRDGVYRRIRLFNRFSDGPVLPSLATAMTLPLFNNGKSISYDQNLAQFGDLRVPLDGSGNYLINPYGFVETYSAAQIIRSMQQIKTGEAENAALDPNYFNGKLVLLGASAIGLLDVKATALAAKEAGVFLHAYTVSNLIDQDFLVKPTHSISLIILLVACCVGVIPLIVVSRPFIATLVSIIGVGFYLAIVYFAFSFNQVLPVTPVVFAILMSLLLAYSLRSYHEKKSQQKIYAMLGPSVSPKVLSAVIDSQEYVEDEIASTETVSILSSSIDGFTDISKSLEARQLVDLLNTFFAEMTEVIFDHDGTLDKFIGDSVLAFWGAPIKIADHPGLALKAAIAMRERVRQTNTILAKNNYPGIDINIGIHSGKVVLGNIGSKQKLEYRIIGDSVNFASGIEKLTKTYGSPIIISDATWAAVRDSIPCIPVDKIRVEGSQKLIQLYAPATPFIERNKLTISTQVLQENIARAFGFYLEQNWKSASESYGQIGECVLSDLFQERCIRYQANEPGAEWEGVFVS